MKFHQNNEIKKNELQQASIELQTFLMDKH